MRVVVEVVIGSQGKINHLGALGNDLGAAAEPGQEVADIAVVPLDGDGQVLAREELVLGDEAVEPFPIAGDEGLALDPNLVDEFLEGLAVTATQHPGEGPAGNGAISPPNPEFPGLFLRKCHISSNVMITVPAAMEGSGRRCAASRTQSSTVTSLTPRMRAMEPKLMFPMAYSSRARAFIAGGLPRGGVIVKLYPHT